MSAADLARHRDVYTAIADPTRRQLLEILRDRGILKAGDLAANFEAVTRPGISRHLRLLRETDLVHASQYGREWHYRLNPKPLADIHDGWLATFAENYVESLSKLREIVEGSP